MTLPNCLFACSVVVIPDGETRKIETFSVFCVTMIFSVFAYVWLLIILVVHSPDRVEVWEAAVTLAFIPVLVFSSWCVQGIVIAISRVWHQYPVLLTLNSTLS